MSVVCEEKIKNIIISLKESDQTFDVSEKEIVKCFQDIFKETKLPVLAKAEDSPYNKNDFIAINKDCIRNLSLMNQLLEELMYAVSHTGCSLSRGSLDAVAVCSVVLAVQYHDSNADWGTEAASVSATAILDLLLLPNTNNITGLNVLEGISTAQFKASGAGAVNGYRLGSAVQPLLQHLSNYFNKSCWKNDPGTREFYLWLLHSLTAPELSSHLRYLLPGALLLLDDWEERHKLAALGALGHVLHSVAGSELCSSGRAAVIYEAAKHHTLCRDPVLLDAVYPVVIKAAEVMDAWQPRDLRITCCEEVLSLLLREMSYEQRLDLRGVFAGHLTAAVAAAGITACRWTTDLMVVVTNYLETYDNEDASDRLHILQTAQQWACLNRVRPAELLSTLLRAVLKLVYDVGRGDQHLTQQAREALLTESQLTVQLLQSASPDCYSRLCRGLDSVALPPGIKATVARVFCGVSAAAS